MKDVIKTAPDKNTKRRRRKRNMSLYYLLILIVVVVVVRFLSRTVLFNISEFVVTGNQKYTVSQILSAGDLETGDNMYRLDIDRVESNIKKNLIYVENVTISRKLPDTLCIEIDEAVAFACCEYEGNRYCVISRGGRYLETEQANKREDLIIVMGLELTGVALGEDITSADEDKINIVFDLFDAADETCPGKITYIDITDRTNIKIGYEERIDIDFGSSLDYEYKLKYITAIIEDNLDENATGKIIYHSATAGASFVSSEYIGD